ncbi:MAG: hypothetical protein ACOZCO_14370 [Bacteroidota bacterium]
MLEEIKMEELAPTPLEWFENNELNSLMLKYGFKKNQDVEIPFIEYKRESKKYPYTISINTSTKRVRLFEGWVIEPSATVWKSMFPENLSDLEALLRMTSFYS